MTKMTTTSANYNKIRAGIVELLNAARTAASRTVNALMAGAYWEIGRRIVQSDQAGEKRAQYGDVLIKRLAKDLSASFGRGFGPRNLAQMRSFFLAWPQDKILQTVSAKSSTHIRFNEIQGTSQPIQDLASRFPLPWSAYVRLLSVKTPDARNFYESETRRSGWSIRQLDRQIASQFYERTALSQNKGAMLEKAENSEPGDLVTPEEAIKDPFVLEFLDLKDEYSESDLEEALIHRLTDFLLELGDDFAFLGRQRRLRIDDTWFRIDLIFFHRRLHGLVIIDLKVGKFSYADAGQNAPLSKLRRRALDEAGRESASWIHFVREKGAAEAATHSTISATRCSPLSIRLSSPDEKLIAELERSRRELEKRAGL